MKIQPPYFNVRFFVGVVLISALTLSLFTFPQGVNAQGLSFPAEINKEFSPISISSGGVSRLSITIFNPNLFQLTNAAWADNLIGVQPGIAIASPVNLTNTCGGTVTAPTGGTSLSLTGGAVPPQVGITPGACTVSIDVTSTTPGNLINTIPSGGLTADGGGGTITNTTPASATLRVGAVQPPLIGKTFNPNTMFVGQTSQLTIAINNVDSNVSLTQTTFTDNLPANVVLANPVAATLNGCGASATLIASSGSGSLTLNNGTILPGAVCLITVNVTSTVEGAYTNTIPPGAIQTTQAVTNQGPASAPLNVQGTRVTKAFAPPNFEAGGTTTLTITIQNPTTTLLTGVNLSDTLPVELNVVAGTATTTCGSGVASTTLPGTVTLTGGTVPAANPPTIGTCTISVQVTAPIGTDPTTYLNTIPAGALTTDQGITNANSATAQVRVYTPGEGVRTTKGFLPSTINPGENSRLRIIIAAPADKDLTNFSIVDNFPPNLTVSNSTPPTKSAGCGAASVLTAVTGATSISLTNGTILAGTTCTIDVYVTSSVSGVYTNTINPGDITNNEGETLPNPISVNLTVRSISDLSISKAFTPAIVGPNGISLLTISLTNTNTSPLVNVSLLDNLPGDTTNGVVVAPVPNAMTTCGSGAVTAVPGTQVISMSGGTIPAQVGGVPGLCTITLNVQGKGTGTGINIIPAANVSGTIQGTPTVINPINDATAPFTITGLSIGVVKEFNPLTVFGGSASTMSVQLVNPNNADLVGIAFTDNMPTGMIVANPVNPTVGTCGGTITATPGGASFSFSGGNLPPFGSCTLSLGITMNVNGNLTNTIDAGAVTTTNGASNPQPAKASLTNLPGASVSKSFSPNPINAGEYSLLTITIQNTGNIALTGMGLNDNLPGTLPAGLAVAGSPAPAPVNNCGGTLTAVAGSQFIQLTNGSLGASSSCTIVIAVTSSTPGSYQNIIPAGSLTTNEGATNNSPTSDTLVVNGGPATASLGNYVWNDTNADGIQDATENGIDGVTVNLYSSNGTLIATTTTSGGGLYLFTGLTPGDYYVEFIPPAGYTFSPQDQGGNDASDSDANPVNGRTIITTLTAGENDLTWDAGLFQQQNPTGLNKTITATNLPATTGTNTAIGEIVTYQVVVTVPPGIYPNATLIDTMQRGLAFVGCDSITAPGLTTDVAGSFTSICSNATTSDAGGGTPADVDRRVTYNFGVLTNAGQTDATVTLTYRAIVLNIAANTNGITLNNSATWSWTGGSIGPAQTTVTIAEPELTINKTANVSFVSNGSEVTFTLTVSHAPGSNSDAYDVVVTDILPTGLSYVANSLDCTVGAQDPDAGCTFDNSNPAQPTIRAQWTVFTRNGGTAQIRFRVTGNSSLPANTNVTNTANVEWSSMPGNQTAPQSFTPNIFSTERRYDPNDAVNVYNSTSALTLTRLGPGGGGNGGGSGNNNSSNQGGFLIPLTGFAPNTVTELNPATRPSYGSLSLTLEIPSIRVSAPVVGVQLNAGNWDVSWLVDQAGWLEGTAYPTWNGNSVLTAHVVNADGKPGLFSRLNKVRVGDYIFVDQSGYRYTYRVVSNKYVQANDINVLKHDDKATITLVTCDSYNEKTNTYNRRVVVRAVLIDVSAIK